VPFATLKATDCGESLREAGRDDRSDAWRNVRVLGAMTRGLESNLSSKLDTKPERRAAIGDTLPDVQQRSVS
jgi:hypothetical protein